MARPRQPIEVVIAKGKKNLTKAEIQERRDREVKPIADNLDPPSYLTKKQKTEFVRISEQLQKLNIMGETDTDALARYIIARDFYLMTIKKMRSKEVMSSPLYFDALSKTQERFFKQCRACANDLGLTISSRCKLVVPASNEPTKKESKFNKFKKGTVDNE